MPRHVFAEEVAQEDPLLGKLLDAKLISALEAVETNSLIAESILKFATDELERSRVSYTSKSSPLPLNRAEVSATVRTTLRQFWRDWSDFAEAQKEREAAYGPVIRELQEEFLDKADHDYQSTSEDGFSPSYSTSSFGGHLTKDQRPILIPGSGLSRLAFDIFLKVKMNVEANELSYHHLLAVSWLLTRLGKDPLKLHPWALQFSNHANSGRQFEAYEIPVYKEEVSELKYEMTPKGLRLSISDSLSPDTFNITTHDFHLYSGAEYKESFAAVATVFFVDTAPNIATYVKIMHHILPEGGIWVNNGPLLWNCWENGPPACGEGDHEDDWAAKARHGKNLVEKGSSWGEKVELSWDELLWYIGRMGFRVEKSDTSQQSGYILDADSMLHSNYRLGFFVARKVTEA